MAIAQLIQTQDLYLNLGEEPLFKVEIFPRMTVFHGLENVISLVFDSVAKFLEINVSVSWFAWTLLLHLICLTFCAVVIPFNVT